MKLSYAGCSQRGQVRPRNEDAYLMRVSPRAALFLVADGIGGRAHGSLVCGTGTTGGFRTGSALVRPWISPPPLPG